jgi:hypothetical protein
VKGTCQTEDATEATIKAFQEASGSQGGGQPAREALEDGQEGEGDGQVAFEGGDSGGLRDSKWLAKGVETLTGDRAVSGAKNSSGKADTMETEGKGLVASEGVIDHDGRPDIAEFVEDTALRGEVGIAGLESCFQALGLDPSQALAASVDDAG